jgi:hypothetical protein
LKQLFRSLRTKLGKPGRAPAGDAITQMILGVFARDVPESKAREALDRLRSMVVDYNELRVVPAIEMAEMVGELPQARLKCEDLSRALNAVFAREHEVSLDRLPGLSKKEAVAYLESIDGLDPYSRARIRLLGLQQHAIPLDEAMWAYARKTEIVARRCPLEEAQAFLERRIPEGEALEFVGLLEKQAWAEMGASVRDGEVEPIRSMPPDRTTRNMLQLIASGGTATAAGADSADAAAPATARRPATVAKRRPRKPAESARKRRERVKAAKPARSTRSSAKRPSKKARRPKAKAPKRTRPKRKPTARRKARARKAAQATKPAKRSRRAAVRAKSA